MSNLIKISLLGTELFNADGRTDMTKLIVVIRNIVKVPQPKCVLVNVMKARMGSRITSPRILNLGFRWKKVLNFPPRPLNSYGKPRITHWIGGKFGLRASLDILEENLQPGTET